MKRKLAERVIRFGPITSTVVTVGLFTSVIVFLFEGIADRDFARFLSGFFSLLGLFCYVPVAKEVERTWREAEKRDETDPQIAVVALLTLEGKQNRLETVGTWASFSYGLFFVSIVILCWQYLNPLFVSIGMLWRSI